MGVIADFDCMKLIMDTPLKDKLASGRLIFRLTNKHGLKNIFKMYKSGEIDQAELTMLISGNDKKLNDVILSILKRLPEYITPNEKVIELMRELKNRGAKVIILSNTIPETEYVIKKYDTFTEDNYQIHGYNREEMRSKKQVNAFEYLLGKESYGAFKEALLSTYYAYSFEISVFAILEMMLLFLSIIVLAVTAFKLVEKAVQLVRKNLGAFRLLKAEEKYILVEWHCAKKIYLHFCRLLN